MSGSIRMLRGCYDTCANYEFFSCSPPPFRDVQSPVCVYVGGWEWEGGEMMRVIKYTFRRYMVAPRTHISSKHPAGVAGPCTAVQYQEWRHEIRYLESLKGTWEGFDAWASCSDSDLGALGGTEGINIFLEKLQAILRCSQIENLSSR